MLINDGTAAFADQTASRPPAATDQNRRDAPAIDWDGDLDVIAQWGDVPIKTASACSPMRPLLDSWPPPTPAAAAHSRISTATVT